MVELASGDFWHSKKDRVAKALVLVEDRKVFLPTQAPWLDELILELAAFPAGVKDDQVDALSQAVKFLRLYLKSGYNPHFEGG
jgi:predicted phage terminase large subunit-like protein